MNTTSAMPISEKQFMKQYEIAKHYVDMGIEDYFILLDNDAFRNVSEIGNTTLSDVASAFGEAYPYFFRFAGFFDNGDGPENRECYQTFEIRPLTNGDKKKLRNQIRFFPNSCWVCAWKDATKFGLLLPFTQKQDGEIKFLHSDPIYMKNRNSGRLDGQTAPEMYLKRVVELLPDYYDALFAVVKYKHVDIAIPVEKNTANRTFKNREKDSDGVKRHLIHNVKQHSRATLKNADFVESHLRGRSNFTINGIDVTLMASWEWSKREVKKGIKQ